MTTNPFINALAAGAYIVIVASGIFGSADLVQIPEPHVFYPIFALSLLVFSVSIMAYLFFYQPVRLLLEDKQKEALRFFLTTVGSFGVLMLLVLMTLVIFISST